jgi:hypothetical protein
VTPALLDAMREVDRLHRIADDLWERSLLT